MAIHRVTIFQNKSPTTFDVVYPESVVGFTNTIGHAVVVFHNADGVVAFGYSGTDCCKTAGNGKVVVCNCNRTIAIARHHRIGIVNTFVGIVMSTGCKRDFGQLGI